MGGRARRQQNRIMQQANDLTAQQMAENRELQREMIAKYEARQAEYEAMEFFNPYENMQNYYADLQNAYVGMENQFEDLGVSTVAADFQMQQGAQQRADIMSALSGAAGGSGIGALAQSLANQGVLQSRQVAVDLAQQQRQNLLMSAQAQQQIDQLQRSTDMTIQQAIAQGAASADMAERGGLSMLQGAEIGRQSTLLGMSSGDYAGANAGVQQAYANQMGALGMGAQMMNARMGMWGQIIGGVAGGIGSAIGSDRKLKKNIEYMFDSPSGIPVYNFEYIDAKHGSGVHQGVMSDEVPREAVIMHPRGYEMVDYSMLDVEFKKLS
tara:strand:- start:8939 stop:9913 length:975 start_codon:yes stop_codon:yes gene_type:complete